MGAEQREGALVRVLALGTSRQFMRVVGELRGWGYAVVAARDIAQAQDRRETFDLACVQSDPGQAASFDIAAVENAFPGLPLLAVSSAWELERLIFAVEEALARGPQEAAQSALTRQQRAQAVRMRRRPLEAKRLTDFLARNTDRRFFFDFQPAKRQKER